METKHCCHPGTTKGSEGSPKKPLARRYFAIAQYDSGTYIKVSNKKTVVFSTTV